MPRTSIWKELGKPFPSLGEVQRRDGASGPLINGYFDQDNSLIKWPGVSLFKDFSAAGKPIQGIYESQKTANVYVVYDNLLRKIAQDGTATTITGTTLSSVGPRASFDEDSTQMFVCNTSKINRVNEGAGTAALITGGTAPDNCTHLFFMNGFLNANGLQSGGVLGDTNFSDDSVNNYAAWELFNNELNPTDGNIALFKNRDESVAFGAYSVEPSYLDGVTPWAVIQGAQSYWGLRAPNTVVLHGDSFMFLTVMDNWVRFVRFDRRTPVDISRPYESIFGYISGAINAHAHAMTWNGAPFYVCRFPSDNRTFVYSIRRNEWYEWATWDGNIFSAFPINAYAYIQSWNKHLVGSATDAKLYYLDGSLTNAVGGSIIRTTWETAAVSHSSTRWKRQNHLTFWFSQGAASQAVSGIGYWGQTWWGTGGGTYWVTGWWPSGGSVVATDPKIQVSIKDDGHPTYTNLQECRVDSASDRLYFSRMNGGGRYRARSYQIVQEETNSGLVLVDVEEDFDWLSR